MKIKQLKKRWRIQLTSPDSRVYRQIHWRDREEMVKNVRQFCNRTFGIDQERYGFLHSGQVPRWRAPMNRQEVYVYFRDEQDALFFMLSYNSNVINGLAT